MAAFKKIIFMVILVAVLGGLGALMVMDIPAPSNEVNKTLDDDRFPA